MMCRTTAEPMKPAPPVTRILMAARPDASVMEDLAEEELGALVARVGEERLRLVLLDDLAPVHEDHAIGHGAREAHLVGDAEHGHALAGELDHDVQYLLDHLRIEGGGRLVEQHDLGPHAERAGDRHALLLA